MVTRFTRLLIVLQLIIAAALCIALITIWEIHSVVAALLIAVGLVVSVRMTISANNFFIAWLYRSETPESFNFRLYHALRLFHNEFLASMFSSTWTMAFCSFSKRVVEQPAGLPLLLIHGYGCNSGYWHSMSRFLLKHRFTHYAVDLEPMFADIDDYVPSVAAAIDLICAETGAKKVIIIAHSMGGLVTRAYLRRQGTERVAKVITLGTPHRGTALANFGKGLNSHQMQWRGNAAQGQSSEWLRKLEESENENTRALFTSIYSHHDNIISPQTSSHLAGATNIELFGIGHVSLAMNRTVQELVVKEAQAASNAGMAQNDSITETA